jgi:uncharacterized protein
MSTSRTPALVIDTNVVLDRLVFRDASVDSLFAALAGQECHWLATPAMRQELEHVLTLGCLSRWRPDIPSVLAAWDGLARLVDPLPAPPSVGLRCTDPDDQKFIDLALQVGAGALLSRDRAVLKLAGRARRYGLAIATPETWAESRGAPVASR